MNLQIVKRDGESVAFDRSKIENAIEKAYVNAGKVSSYGIDKSEIARIVDKVEKEVVDRFSDSDILVNVENIHDIVEKCLMHSDLLDVAKSYIIYRAQKRERSNEDRKKLSFLKTLNVKKKGGKVVPFSPRKLKDTIKRHSSGLAVDREVLFSETVKNLYDNMKSDDIDKALILGATSLIEMDPSYSDFSARIFRQKLAKEVFGKSTQSGSADWDKSYREFFAKNVSDGVVAGVYDPRLSSVFDLADLSSYLKLERDDLIDFIGVHTLYERYLAKIGERHAETIQHFWMRVAMGLAILEEDPNARAKEFYDCISQLYNTPSTPTLFHSGLVHSQLSSCYLTTVDDDLKHIFRSYSDNAQMAKWSGGIGNDWTPVRATGAMVKTSRIDSQGTIPFLKIANDTTLAINRSGKRRGATAVYLETWHLDIEDFLDLKKNTGDERRRAPDLNTVNWIPDLFMKRVEENGVWTLFSPEEVPDLHDTYGKKFEERYCHYEQCAKRGEIKKFKVVEAVKLERKMLTMIFETGHPWHVYKDPCNIRSPQDHAGVVHSSNLCCVAADQLVVTSKGMLTVGEMYDTNVEQWHLAGKDGVVKSSPMLLPRPDAPMCRIITVEGYTHKVTPDHKVWVVDHGHKEAKDLVVGDKIALQSTCGIWGSVDEPGLALICGLIAGYGTFDIDFWKKNSLVASEIDDIVCSVVEKYQYLGYELKPSALLEVLELKGVRPDTKFIVPEFVLRGNEKTVSSYLRGIYSTGGESGSICSTSSSLLETLQIIWSNLGVKTILAKEGEEGCRLTYVSMRDDLEKEEMYATFSRLEDLPNEDAYCVTVDAEDHLWTVNGLLTKNTEITLNTIATKLNEDLSVKELGEVACCNLSSLNLVRHMVMIDGQWVMDWDRLRETIKTAMRMLDNVIDINFYPIPEARNSNLKHRPVGLGQMGCQDALFLADINYEESDVFVDEVAEFIAYHAIWSSSELAIERGSYESFKGSKWDRGIFPLDTIKLLEEERGIPVDVDRVSRMDWKFLKDFVRKNGMRNSNTMAVAPTACVHGDTLVLTDRGILPISKMGDESGNQWQDLDCKIVADDSTKVATKFFINGVRDALEVTTIRGHKLICTNNHRLRVVDGEGKYVWKYALDISPGDLVVRKIGGHKELMADAPLVVLLPDDSPVHWNENIFDCPELMDEKLSEVLGYYMGDGYLRNLDLGLVVCDKDEDLVNHWGNYFNSIGLNYSVEQRETSVKIIHVFSKRLERWFGINNFRKPTGNNGEGSFGAFVPESVLKSRTSVVCAFLRGLFEAEGTITTQRSGSLVVEMSTVSPILSEQVHVCLEYLGIRSTRHVSKPGSKGYRPVWRVRLSNVESVKKFKDIIGFISDRKKELLYGAENTSSYKHRGDNVPNLKSIVEFKKSIMSVKHDKEDIQSINYCLYSGSINKSIVARMLSKYPESINTVLGFIVSNDLDAVVVKSVKKVKKVPTFDISVPNGNTYVANGFVSHNTISTVAGVLGACGEPIFKNLFAKSNMSGEFTVVNRYLVDDLKKLGMWDRDMLDQIKYHNGSIQKIDKIPLKLRQKYKEVWEIDQKRQIDLTALRSKWIDQSQSHNIFLAVNSGKLMAEIYHYAWRKGLKSTYYLRTMGASGTEKATLDAKYGLTQKREEIPAVKVCRIDDPSCESCQ